MLRNNSDQNKEIKLFIGTSRLIIVSSTRQIDYALRTIVVTEKTLYTFLPRAQDDVRWSRQSNKSYAEQEV